MHDNELIPVTVERNKTKKNKRKNKFLTKLTLYMIIVLVIYGVYTNFDKIKVFLENYNNSRQESPSNNQNSNDNEENTENPSNDNNDNSSNDNLNVTVIPNDAHKINTVETSFTEVNNESGLNTDIDLSNEIVPTVKDTYERYGKDAPHILIIHSACNEGYSNGMYYTFDDDFYSTKDNVKAVGKIICETLNEKHINAIHIDDIFGSGAIYKSRKEFEFAIEKTLKAYPSIKIVLDISRGMNINDDLTMDKMITKINENNVAQIAITVGSDIESENIFGKNLNFAQVLATSGDNLIYDITIAPFKLSQDIDPVFLNVNIGSYSNTIDEAILAGCEFANLLYDVLS